MARITQHGTADFLTTLVPKSQHKAKEAKLKDYIDARLANTVNSTTTLLPNAAADSRPVKAIIIAGQSNAYCADDWLRTATIPLTRADGARYDGLYEWSEEGVLEPLTNGLHIESPNMHMGFGPSLAALINNTLEPGAKLIVVAVADSHSGWANGRWSADGDLWLKLVKKIRQINIALNVEWIGAFWAQGETDVIYPYAANYHGLLDTLAITLREICGNIRMPFVTYQMVPSWVGADKHKTQVQQALATIGDRIPYAASINVNDLPGRSIDGESHYSAAQQVELSKRFMAAWRLAQRGTLVKYPPPITEKKIIMTEDNVRRYNNRWDAVCYGSKETQNLWYSCLNELWKYRTADGRYHLLLRYSYLQGEVREYEVIQKHSPLAFTHADMPVEVIKLTGPIGDAQASGCPSGIAVLTNVSNVDGESTLLSAQHQQGNNAVWAPLGLSESVYRTAESHHSSLPVFSGDTSSHASQLELYALP